MRNLYHVVQIGTKEDGTKMFGVQYKDKFLKYIGFPESWGTRQHATNYMAGMLGLTYKEYQECKGSLE